MNMADLSPDISPLPEPPSGRDATQAGARDALDETGRRAAQVVAVPAKVAGGPDWPRLHLWQIQPLRDALILLAVIGLLYLGSVLSIVTVPLLLALLLAYLFEPLVRRMLRVPWISRQGAAVTSSSRRFLRHSAFSRKRSAATQVDV